MSSNNKKTKKKMSPETKEKVVAIFKSIISNESAIQSARHNPWWAALIVFLLSIIIAVIPIFVSYNSSYGSSFVASKTYGLDTTLTVLFTDMYQKNVNLKVEDNGKLYEVNTGEWLTFAGSDGEYKYINSNSNQVDLIAVYTTKTGTDLGAYTTALNARKYVAGTSDLYQENSDASTSEEIKTYSASFIIFTNENILIQVFKPGTTTTVAAYSGDYARYIGSSIKDLVVSNKYDASYVTSADITHLDSAYIKESFANFKTFLDNAYLNNKVTYLWRYTLLALGVNFVLGLFLGALVFILTRGKKNVYHVLSFLTCMKIEAWCMFTPALLAMIVAFLLPTYAMMYFIILLGMRTMWLTIRQLRPVTQ